MTESEAWLEVARRIAKSGRGRVVTDCVGMDTVFDDLDNEGLLGGPSGANGSNSVWLAMDRRSHGYLVDEWEFEDCNRHPCGARIIAAIWLSLDAAAMEMRGETK